jgi:hypothetical protein
MKKTCVTICAAVLLVFLAVILGGCKKKASTKGTATSAGNGTEQSSAPKPSGKTGLHPVPPDLPVPVDGAKPDRHPILVYWSNTTSERGYIQDRQRAANPSSAFRFFVEAFRGALDYGYAPEYYRLEKDSGNIIDWRPIDERLFDPNAGSYYDSVRGGNFKNRDGLELGPLMMLYEDGRVRPADLTVVVSDLEEQGLNATRLARNIHDMLFSSAEGWRNAAAVVALNVPFNGDNFKPDPGTGKMITQPISGGKPLYMVVTGRKDAVAVFVRAYEITAKDKGVDSRLVTTLFPGDIRPLPLSGITIPNSANLKEQRDVDRNKGVLKNLWNFRNETASRIWNLTNETRSMVRHLGIPNGADGALTTLTNEQLNLHLLQYKQMGGGAKNGHRLWQLNIEFAMPGGYDFSHLEAKVENYRYLSEGEWKSSAALLSNDLEVSKTPFPVGAERAGVYVVPRNRKGMVDAGNIVYFEVVLRAPVVIPDWVHELNDDQSGTTPGKTRSLRAFVEVVLGLNAGAGPTIIKTDNELARVPVMLLDIPSKKGRK